MSGHLLTGPDYSEEKKKSFERLSQNIDSVFSLWKFISTVGVDTESAEVKRNITDELKRISSHFAPSVQKSAKIYLALFANDSKTEGRRFHEFEKSVNADSESEEIYLLINILRIARSHINKNTLIRRFRSDQSFFKKTVFQNVGVTFDWDHAVKEVVYEPFHVAVLCNQDAFDQIQVDIGKKISSGFHLRSTPISLLPFSASKKVNSWAIEHERVHNSLDKSIRLSREDRFINITLPGLFRRYETSVGENEDHLAGQLKLEIMGMRSFRIIEGMKEELLAAVPCLERNGFTIVGDRQHPARLKELSMIFETFGGDLKELIDLFERKGQTIEDLELSVFCKRMNRTLLRRFIELADVMKIAVSLGQRMDNNDAHIMIHILFTVLKTQQYKSIIPFLFERFGSDLVQKQLKVVESIEFCNFQAKSLRQFVLRLERGEILLQPRDREILANKLDGFHYADIPLSSIGITSPSTLRSYLLLIGRLTKHLDGFVSQENIEDFQRRLRSKYSTQIRSKEQ